MSEVLCAFGCERPARKQLKNGKSVCSEFVSSCPVMRVKNSTIKKGKNPFEGRVHPRGMSGKTAWNSGKRYEQTYDAATATRIRQAQRLGNQKTQEILRSSPDLETGRRQKLSEVALKRRLGGYQRGSGRGKKGWYRGFWCDSSYELAFVIFALDHAIVFERNLEVFPYEFKGKLLRWIPDFRLSNGTYLEIKGYQSEQAKAKFAAFAHPLQVLQRADMAHIFDYVLDKYGRDYVELYE